MKSEQAFTAAQLAAALGKTRQGMSKALCDVTPAGTRTVGGQSAPVWTVDQLPARLRECLAIEATRQNCTVEALLSLPRRQWQPPIAMSNISHESKRQAEKLREALRPFLTAPYDPNLTAEEWKQRGVDYHFRVFKDRPRITTHHWDRLFRRTQIRDNGVQNWDSLQIYLPDRLKRKPSQNETVQFNLGSDFCGLENYLRAIKTPGQPDKDEVIGIWNLALTTMKQLMAAGELEKRAARRVRQFLFARAAFMAPTKDALWIAFKRKIAALKRAGGLPDAIADGRAENGDRVEMAQVDVDRLQWSVSQRNGGSVDAAWREEYPTLTESTRQRYEYSFSAPAKIHALLNREIVDALTARHEGKRQLRRMLPKLRRDWSNVPSMHSWVVDDKTSDVECALKNQDGSVSLIRPQIIAVMDSASRKFVGWTVSVAKAPNARIVCDAVKTGFRIHGVPKRLGLENGKVFGKSALVNGKEDDFGQTLVVGLGHFGCELHHFEKMNPTSKSELEYGFRQLDRLMERWPGYGGPIQMLSDFEDFKREKRLIEAGKAEPTKFRMTFDEFIVEFQKVVLKYNATQQQGRLKGLSPDESFSGSMDANDPPIKFTPKMDWMLSDRELVPIKIGGAKFTYRATRETIYVIGGELVNFVGEELWALMDPRDTAIVTFMTKDFTQTFTMETSQEVHPRQKDFDPGSETMEKERAGIREHERAISEKYQAQQNQFGNPRRDMLKQMRDQTNALADVPDQTTRRVILNSRIEASGEQMAAQRAEITAAKDQKTRRTAANKSKARRAGIPSVLVDDDEGTSRGLELMRAGSRAVTDEVSIEENEP